VAIWATGREDYTSNGAAPFHVVKSSNAGATWGLSAIPDQTSIGIARPTRVAVGIDPSYTGLKIVHTVWRNESGDVMYSYFATRPNQTGWSAPVRINGSYVSEGDIDVLTTSDGALHVLLDSYYSTATTPDSTFSEPVALPASGNSSMIKDAQDNLYVALNDGSNITLTKKAAGNSTWSNPVTVTEEGTAVSGYISLAIADANTYYIGYADYTTSTVILAVTTNGGTNWTNRSVLDLPADFGTDVAIAASSSKVVTLVTGTEPSNGGGNITKAFRTADDGVTWSSSVTLLADQDISIALDANNKALIVARNGIFGYDWSGVTTNPNANLFLIKEQ